MQLPSMTATTRDALTMCPTPAPFRREGWGSTRRALAPPSAVEPASTYPCPWPRGGEPGPWPRALVAHGPGSTGADCQNAGLLLGPGGALWLSASVAPPEEHRRARAARAAASKACTSRSAASSKATMSAAAVPSSAPALDRKSVV